MDLLPGVPRVESPFFDSIFASLDLGEDVMQVARSIRDQGYAVIDVPEDDFE